jgi:hypothetical protein
MRRCTQIKCGHYLQGGCQCCDDCGAEPYNINERCRRCLQCEGEEGELRWGEQGNSDESLLKEKMPPVPEEEVPPVPPPRELPPMVIE